MSSRFRVIRGLRVRVPRRIATGREQLPHPHIAWAAKEECAYRYNAPGPLGDGGGEFVMQRLSQAFKECYS